MVCSSYQKGKIYKIVNLKDDEVYVGSTIQLLSQRMAKHKYKMKSRPNYRLYQHMMLLGTDAFEIKLIENYPCENQDQLREREGVWIQQIGTLNDKIAGRSIKQWNDDNAEYGKEKSKLYRIENQDALKLKRREFRKEHAEELRAKDRQRYKENQDRREATKQRVKKWREENPEYVKQQAKKWREENKERKKEMDKKYREKKKQEQSN